MRNCILAGFILCLFGCNEDSNPIAEKIADSTIYIAWRDGYWKNGVYTSLNTNSMNLNSMWVDGSSVLIGGTVFGEGGSWNVIWKDGKEVLRGETPGGGMTLVASYNNSLAGSWPQTNKWILYRNGITGPIESGSATAIFMTGEDVYLTGNSHGNDYPWGESDFYPLDTYTQCWRNDRLIFKETAHSYANAIFIDGDDIYIGGHLNHYPSLDRVACYWKNGVRVDLTGMDDDAEVRSLFVSSGHVYAAGIINDKAVCWKDGATTYLSGTESSKANSITVLGTDIYVAGGEDKFPAVWKNGVKQVLPDQEKQGDIKVIVAFSNRVTEN